MAVFPAGSEGISKKETGQAKVGIEKVYKNGDQKAFSSVPARVRSHNVHYSTTTVPPASSLSKTATPAFSL